MLILLPAAVYLLFYLLFQRRLACSPSRRVNLLLAALAWALTLTLLTELLSLFSALRPFPLAVAWGVVLLAALAAFLRLPSRPVQIAAALPAPLSWIEKTWLAGMAAVLGLTLLIALLAAPNNWDSMVYHLSRVAHWAQNGTVAFYPTATLRQLFLNPWSEYALAHFFILAGGDRFVNLLQWLALPASLAGVSWIARQLGAPRSGQILAALAAATLPMSVLQATTTQNDLAAALWLVCLVVFLIEYVRAPSAWSLAAAGVALGLAVLTKSTAYLFALPFMLLFAAWGLRRLRLAFIRPLAVLAFLALLVNLPHYARNTALFASPIGPSQETVLYRNDRFTPAVLVSNLTRNLALHLATVSPFNEAVYDAVAAVHNWIGLDLNDPGTTWQDHVFRVDRYIVNEDASGSPFHLGLLALTVVMLILRRRRVPARAALVYAGLLAAGLLVFSAFLRWQTWHPRLHLPLLILACPLLGLLPALIHRRLVLAVGLALIAFTAPIFYFNPARPLLADFTIFNLPRREVMIIRKNLVVPYIEGVNHILGRGCAQVGLYLPDGEWEYPVWNLMAASGLPGVRIEHVAVDNVSARLDRGDFQPCAVFSTVPLPAGEFVGRDGSRYPLAWSLDPVYIYAPPE